MTMIKEKEKSIVLRQVGDVIRMEVTNMSPVEVLNVLVSFAIDLAIDNGYYEGGSGDED